jgi:hypothetical protein
LLLDEFEQDCARQVAADWQLPPRVTTAIVGWRGYQALAMHRDDAVLTHAAKQLATASLHPGLVEGGYLTDNPVFTELKMDAKTLDEMMSRSEEIRAFIAAF